MKLQSFTEYMKELYTASKIEKPKPPTGWRSFSPHDASGFPVMREWTAEERRAFEEKCTVQAVMDENPYDREKQSTAFFLFMDLRERERNGQDTKEHSFDWMGYENLLKDLGMEEPEDRDFDFHGTTITYY